MLLPGRVVVDTAGRSRPPEKGGGGGGARGMEACELSCGEGGSIGRPLKFGGGGGGGLSCAAKDGTTYQQTGDRTSKAAWRKEGARWAK